MRGWDSVTVPGAVAGWVALSQRFGKLPFADLLEPAIELAERGYGVGRDHRRQVGARRCRCCRTSRASPRPSCRAAARRRPASASSSPRPARRCARSPRRKGEAFYRGEIAARLVAHAARQRRRDDAWPTWPRTAPSWVTPIQKDYAGHTVHEIPPNGQGIAALMALGMLEHARPRPPRRSDSVESQHLQIEAMKLAFADTYRWVADARAMTEVTAADLLSDGLPEPNARS